MEKKQREETEEKFQVEINDLLDKVEGELEAERR